MYVQDLPAMLTIFCILPEHPQKRAVKIVGNASEARDQVFLARLVSPWKSMET